MTDEGAAKEPPSEASAGSSGGAVPSGSASNGGVRVKAIAALAAMFVLGGLAGVAVGRVSAMREVRHMMEGPPGDARASFRLEALRRRLDLRPEQVDRVRAVMAEADAERDKLMGACGPGLDELRRSTDAKMREVLDDDQRKRFDELSRRRGKPGPWNEGPPPPPR